MGSRSFTLRAGQSLMEVLIATLIAAITTVAVFSVVLSSFVTQKKADKKEQIALVMRAAQQTLQTFVSADLTTPVYTSAGTYYAPNLGGIWSADTTGSWALAPGRHDISSLMNTPEYIDLRRDSVTNTVYTCADGGGCYLVYDVTDDHGPACVGGLLGAVTTEACKNVVASMKYAD
jgi:type II secretory pathway pseudopilin PulG